MCGIVAQYGRGDIAELQRMLARLTHRGPDDDGSVVLGHGWLGHTRLSIVDLAHGRQPLLSVDGQAWLVGNGGGYNHEGVGGDVGGPFRTVSDNEVALHLLHHEGPAALAQLNGMFAFVMA